MNQSKFEKAIQSSKPVVVEFWAPWCGPCKAMTPMYLKAEKEYRNRVELVRINVDESQELARSLHIFSIPTVMVYKKGTRILKKTGAMGYDQLIKVFEAGLHEQTATQIGISRIDRWLRIFIAIALIVLGIITGYQLVFWSAAGLFFFLAIYDRCPIWKAVTHWFSHRFRQDQPPTQNES